MARIRLCAALAVALIVLAAPVPGAGASEGKVVIAQGVDPSTLDAMNQQETPASVVAAHLYDTLVERDQNLKLVPGLAAEMPKLLAPTVWEIKLRKGVVPQRGRLQRGLREVQPGACEGSLDARQLQLQAHRPRGDRRSLHGEGAYLQAVAHLRGRPHPAPGFDVSAQR